MKTWIFALGFLLWGGTLAAQVRESLAIGKALPMEDWKMESVEGEEVSLIDEMGPQGLLVIFSCNTCPYVIKAQDRTQELIDYALEREIGVIILNSNQAQRDGVDSREAMADYAQEHGYTVPYVMDDDSRLADAFGATRTPEVFLFNKEKVLVYKGAMEDQPANPPASEQIFLQMAIDHMLAEKPIDPEHTVSVGCTIKRK